MEQASQSVAVSRPSMALAFFLPIVLLLPFINRAYNIDEPMFVWVAQQIVQEPFDYFGGAVDRSDGPEPMYEYNQNPPGFSYVLAIVGAIGGWSEPVLHLASLLAAGLCSLGTYLVAVRLSPRPLLAALLTVVTPGFFVSATSVMTDVAMTASYVWAVYLWLRWLDSGRRGELAGAVVLITVGTLMKYYAITLVPLFAVYTLMKRRRAGAWTAALVVPVAAVVLFWWWSWRLYGVNLLEVAAAVAQDPSVRAGDEPMFRPIVTLLFVGGCFAPMALCSPIVLRPLGALAWIATIVAVLAFKIDGYSLLQLMIGTTERYGLVMLAQMGLMLAAGGVLLVMPIRDVVRHRDAEGVLLGLWMFGAIIYTLYVNHLINARTLLPLAPALGIVIARNLPAATGRAVQFAPVALGALLSLWVAWGDYAVAEGGRHAAREAIARAEAEQAKLYYAGLWGFQYYVGASGAKPFSVVDGGYGGEHTIKMAHGDFLAISSDSREKWRRAPDRFEEIAFPNVANRARVATYHPVDPAGFYSHLSGILPYKFGQSSPEEYGIYRWLGPSYVPEIAPAAGVAP